MGTIKKITEREQPTLCVGRGATQLNGKAKAKPHPINKACGSNCPLTCLSFMLQTPSQSAVFQFVLLAKEKVLLVLYESIFIRLASLILLIKWSLSLLTIIYNFDESTCK